MQGMLIDLPPAETKPKRVKPTPKPVGEVDITAKYHKGHKQSVKAFEQNKEALKGQALRIYEFIAARDGEDGRKLGATADEVSLEMKISESSSSARFSDLKRAELIFETELERLTRWKNTATVCVVAEHRDKAAQLAANGKAVKENQ